jgi:HPt (histidine-containing phosphotransfer) domain-containing protein
MEPAAAMSASAAPAPTASRCDPALVDVSVLSRLLGNDPGTLRRLLGIYLSSLRSSVEELQAAFAANDVRAIGNIAHRLKSASRSVGALALGDLCAEMENACRAGDPVAIAEGSTGLLAALAAVDGCVDELIDAT